MAEFSFDKAKEVLEAGVDQAQDVLKDTPKVDAVLEQLQEKLQTVPYAGDLLASVPEMILMIKSYITQEYTNVSPKVIALMVSAAIYFVKGKDLINDKIPLIGHVDDVAVLAAALKLSEKELDDYKAWRTGVRTAEAQPEVTEETTEE